MVLPKQIDFMPYMVRDNTGGQTYVDSVFTVNLDQVVLSHDNYSLSNDVVTVTLGGLYWISYLFRYAETDTSGGSRSAQLSWMEADTVEIVGSRAPHYYREAAQRGSTQCVFLAQLSDGDELRLRAQQEVDQPNIETDVGTQICFIRLG